MLLCLANHAVLSQIASKSIPYLRLIHLGRMTLPMKQNELFHPAICDDLLAAWID